MYSIIINYNKHCTDGLITLIHIIQISDYILVTRLLIGTVYTVPSY